MTSLIQKSLNIKKKGKSMGSRKKSKRREDNQSFLIFNSPLNKKKHTKIFVHCIKNTKKKSIYVEKQTNTFFFCIHNSPLIHIK